MAKTGHYVYWYIDIFGFMFHVSILTTIRLISIKFGKHIRCAHRINFGDFDDPLTSPTAPPADQSVHVSYEISRHLQDVLA